MLSFKSKTKRTDVKDMSVLSIDCRNCERPDLGNIGCVRCIGESIVRFGDPEKVILRSGVEEEFPHEVVDLLRKISDAFCRTSVGREGRRCTDCVLSRESLEEEKWSELSLENIDEIRDRLSKVYLECPECQTCISDAQRYFSILRDKLDVLSKDAAMVAFRIVGA